MAAPIIAGYPQSESECGKQMISGIHATDNPSAGSLFQASQVLSSQVLSTQAGDLS